MRGMRDARRTAPSSDGRAARRALVGLMGLLGALLLALPAAANAKAINYVSIGDSYTSGPGIDAVRSTTKPLRNAGSRRTELPAPRRERAETDADGRQLRRGDDLG